MKILIFPHFHIEYTMYLVDSVSKANNEKMIQTS